MPSHLMWLINKVYLSLYCAADVIQCEDDWTRWTYWLGISQTLQLRRVRVWVCPIEFIWQWSCRRRSERTSAC